VACSNGQKQSAEVDWSKQTTSMMDGNMRKKNGQGNRSQKGGTAGHAWMMKQGHMHVRIKLEPS
jgi:hypothetical protein